MSERDITPALGSSGTPDFGERSGAPVHLHRRDWQDGRWSFLYGADTGYANVEPEPGQIAGASRRARTGPLPDVVQGPVMHGPVWTWEVPVYFWLGGMAAGASFVAAACDLAGDEDAARVARKVALAAVLPSPPLLIMDLGRPLRFLNMLRVFKPRSPMSMGVWCLVTFSNLAAGAVAADLLGRRRLARTLGAANAIVGGYLGSYTGVLLAATAVPVWARSRLLLGPIFVATATATGASACRLVLAARGMPDGHPTREALGKVETIAIGAELLLSEVNERRLGPLAEGLETGTAGGHFKRAKWLVRAGLAMHLPRRVTGPWIHHVASGCYLAGAFFFRQAWVAAGKTSAADHRAVAAMARARHHGD